LADPAPLSWGVIGATSWVAVKAVIPAIVGSPKARLVAVASQSANTPPSADGRRTYRSYAALLDDPDVEAVYVPLPNSLHRTWVERAALAGKHVLCEKPLAPTAADAAAMASASAAAGVTLLEAYMTPFHPRAAAIDALVRGGRLGDLRFARAAFTGVLDRPDDHRWRPDMGGGALLDVGIYCVAPLLVAAGRSPVRVEAAASMATSGVDASFSGWLDFGGGFTAAIECSFDAPERQSLELVGTEAAVLVDRAFTPGPEDVAFALRGRDGRVQRSSPAAPIPTDHDRPLSRGRARWRDTAPLGRGRDRRPRGARPPAPSGRTRRSVRVLVMHVGEMQVAMGEPVMAMAMGMGRAAGLAAGVLMSVVLVVRV
jgi:predicted dehydrogenase